MGSHKTPISILQEICTKRNLTPNYELLVNEGPVHEPLFVFQVTAGDWTASGKGTSKKKAKHNAAYMLLLRLMNNLATSEAENVMLRSLTGTSGMTFPDGVSTCTQQMTTPAMEVAGLGMDEAENGNPVGQLQELCQHNFWPQPYYSFTIESGPYHNREFTCGVTLWKWSVQGHGKSKRIAKRRAALTLYKKIKDNQLTIPQEALDSLEEAQVPFMERSAAEGGVSTSGVTSVGAGDVGSSEPEGLPEPVTREVARFQGPFKNSKREKLNGKLTISLPPPDDDAVSLLEEIGKENNIPFLFTNIPNRSKSGNVGCLLQLQCVPQTVVHGSGPDLHTARQDAALNALQVLDLVCATDELTLEPLSNLNKDDFSILEDSDLKNETNGIKQTCESVVDEDKD